MLLIHLLIKCKKLILKPFLKKSEVDELIIMLEEKKFKLIFVGENSIKAVKEGNWSSPDKTDSKLSNHGHFFVFLRAIIPEKRM